MTFAYKLTIVLILISIAVSGVLAKAMGNINGLVAFSDNMFLAGILLFVISIVLNFIKAIYAFKKKELFPKGQVVSRVFLAAGIINVFISMVFAFLA